MPLARFEPAVPASEGPQTHILDRAFTGIGKYKLILHATYVHLLLPEYCIYVDKHF